MKRPTITLLITATAILNTGCMHLRVVAKDDSSHPVAIRVRHSAYFWGLKQRENIRTPERCNTICKVETTTNMGDIIISFLTLGIIVPQTLEYSCCPFEPTPAED
jgi:hypothetical protein